MHQKGGKRSAVSGQRKRENMDKRENGQKEKYKTFSLSLFVLLSSSPFIPGVYS
jgi:hypothetical protein